MKNLILLLLTVLNMSCQAQQKNTMEQEKIKHKPKVSLYTYFEVIRDEIYFTKKGKISIEHKSVSYNKKEKTITIENIYPHPSKGFNEHVGIFQYSVKNNGKVSFWKGETQVQDTDQFYEKMMEDFIEAGNFLINPAGKYNSRMKLVEDNILEFPDGLKIKLVGFSHKKVEGRNERSPAIAHLELSDKHSEEKWFTLRRSEVFGEQGKFITSYESKDWKNYNIELVRISYGLSVDIIVRKESNRNGSKKFINITNELSTDEFEKIKNFILKNKGRQTYRSYDGYNPHYAFIDFDLYLGADIGQKNISNNPDISDFNELVIRNNILGAPIQYFTLVIVRKGDVNNDKDHILEGMKEDKVYLLDYYEEGFENLQSQLPLFLETIRKRINNR